MGSGQSSAKDRVEYLEQRINREQAAAQREMDRALEQQRQLYEQRFNSLVREQSTPSPHPTAPARATAATPKDVERALEQQRKLYEEKIQELIRDKNGNTSSTGSAATSPHPQPTATANLERQRSPYAYTLNELQTQASNSSITQNLYPNLPRGCAAIPPGNTASSPYAGYGYAAPHNSSIPPDFTIVNTHFVHQQTSPLSQPNQSFQPTAPPAPDTSTDGRSRSVQRGPDADITCPTCGRRFAERIYQCNQGHSSCEVCKSRQVPCGQCRQQLTARRNYDLEKYVAERRVKCPNSADGCQLSVKLADMAIHQKECPFKEMQCPSLGSSCSWKGKISQLGEHFESTHPTHRQAEVDKEMFLSNITNTSHTMHFVKLGFFNFLFHLKVSEYDKMIYMTVQLIGTKHSAAKWDYEIHLYNKSQPRRKYYYIDRCSSSSEQIPDIFRSTKCAMIPIAYAKTFICGGVLAYKFYIKRDDVKEKVNNNKKEFVNVKRAFGKNNRGRAPRRALSKDNGGAQ